MELLVVIVILAILGGAVLIVMGSSGDSARAARIAGNVDALRSAALAYAQTESWNEDAFSGSGLDAGMVRAASLSPYLDREIDGFEVIRTDSRILVGFSNHPEIDEGVSQKLAEMARTDGSLRDADGDVYESGTGVYMYLR